MSVWDWDRFGRNQFLGEFRLALDSLDFTDTSDQWHVLLDKVREREGREGEREREGIEGGGGEREREREGEGEGEREGEGGRKGEGEGIITSSPCCRMKILKEKNSIEDS